MSILNGIYLRHGCVLTGGSRDALPGCSEICSFDELGMLSRRMFLTNGDYMVGDLPLLTSPTVVHHTLLKVGGQDGVKRIYTWSFETTLGSQSLPVGVSNTAVGIPCRRFRVRIRMIKTGIGARLSNYARSVGQHDRQHTAQKGVSEALTIVQATVGTLRRFTSLDSHWPRSPDVIGAR